VFQDDGTPFFPSSICLRMLSVLTMFNCLILLIKRVLNCFFIIKNKIKKNFSHQAVFIFNLLHTPYKHKMVRKANYYKNNGKQSARVIITMVLLQVGPEAL
jgi:hypothetical protein